MVSVSADGAPVRPPPATHNISGDSEFGVRPAPCSLPSHSTHDPHRASLQEPPSLNTPRGLLCSASLRPHPHTLPKRPVLTCAHSPSHAHALTRRLADFHLLYQTPGVRLGPLLSLSGSWGLAARTFFSHSSGLRFRAVLQGASSRWNLRGFFVCIAFCEWQVTGFSADGSGKFPF